MFATHVAEVNRSAFFSLIEHSAGSSSEMSLTHTFSSLERVLRCSAERALILQMNRAPSGRPGRASF